MYSTDIGLSTAMLLATSLFVQLHKPFNIVYHQINETWLQLINFDDKVACTSAFWYKSSFFMIVELILGALPFILILINYLADINSSIT